MAYFVILLAGLAGGALCMYIALDQKRRALAEQRKMQEWERQLLSQTDAELTTKRSDFTKSVDEFRAMESAFQKQVVTYKHLADENIILKRDLKNFAVSFRKSQLDHFHQQESEKQLSGKVDAVAARYLRDSVKWISSSLNPNNFASCRQRLQDLIERLRAVGFKITSHDEASLIEDLKSEYERIVRAAFEKEEQARIKAQIREEQRVEREILREKERVDRERSIIEAALAKALAETKDQHSAEIESLKAQLAAAEAKQRAISQAQLTKAGFIYVISNIGSFGDGVFKVGMTRRLEPMDRVRELGDASVPFPFDVHMMISCGNAPALENALHRALAKCQVNKTNPRKEFFRIDLQTIIALVEKHHGKVEYTADAEALQYRQSLTMSDEDMEFIEHVFDEAAEDSPGFDEEIEQQAANTI